MQKHPHLRGENLTKRRLSVEHLETSPPTWGKPSVNVEQVLIGGNIPTYVGKTRFTNFESVIAMETSPPTWGKPRRRDRERPRPGNIPTYVGKTQALRAAKHQAEKHPHLRGENEPVVMNCGLFSETSPPTWGKPGEVLDFRFEARNIPTYVGKTARFCLDCHYGYYILLKSKFLALSLRQGCAIFAYHPSLGIDLRLAEALRDVPNDCGGRVIKGRLLPN